MNEFMLRASRYGLRVATAVVGQAEGSELQEQQQNAAQPSEDIIASFKSNLRKQLQDNCEYMPKLQQDTKLTRLEDEFVQLTIENMTDGTILPLDDIKSYTYLTDNVRIIVEGEPGSGKTTYMSKLAFDWLHSDENSVLAKFEYLFLLDAKSVQAKKLVEAVQFLYAGELSDNGNAIAACFQSNSCKKIIVLLDGFDEIDDQHAYPVWKEILSDSQQFPQVTFVVTTRPSHVHYIGKIKFRLKISTLNTEQQQALLLKQLGESGAQEIMRRHGFTATDLSDIALTPLFVKVLCVLVQSPNQPNSNSNVNVRSNTFLCDIFKQYHKGLFTFTYMKDKSEELDNYAKEETLEVAGRYAVLTILPLKVRQLLPLEAHQDKKLDGYGIDVGVMETAARTGFVTSIPNTAIQDGYTFFHRLFGEYLAARYLAFEINEGNIKAKKLAKLLDRTASHVSYFISAGSRRYFKAVATMNLLNKARLLKTNQRNLPWLANVYTLNEWWYKDFSGKFSSEVPSRLTRVPTRFNIDCSRLQRNEYRQILLFFACFQPTRLKLQAARLSDEISELFNYAQVVELIECSIEKFPKIALRSLRLESCELSHNALSDALKNKCFEKLEDLCLDMLTFAADAVETTAAPSLAQTISHLPNLKTLCWISENQAANDIIIKAIILQSQLGTLKKLTFGKLTSKKAMTFCDWLSDNKSTIYKQMLLYEEAIACALWTHGPSIKETTYLSIQKFLPEVARIPPSRISPCIPYDAFRLRQEISHPAYSKNWLKLIKILEIEDKDLLEKLLLSETEFLSTIKSWHGSFLLFRCS